MNVSCSSWKNQLSYQINEHINQMSTLCWSILFSWLLDLILWEVFAGEAPAEGDPCTGHKKKHLKHLKLTINDCPWTRNKNYDSLCLKCFRNRPTGLLWLLPTGSGQDQGRDWDCHGKVETQGLESKILRSSCGQKMLRLGWTFFRMWSENSLHLNLLRRWSPLRQMTAWFAHHFKVSHKRKHGGLAIFTGSLSFQWGKEGEIDSFSWIDIPIVVALPLFRMPSVDVSLMTVISPPCNAVVDWHFVVNVLSKKGKHDSERNLKSAAGVF